ncbi:RNA-directed DNA polymerase protein [Dioscorea alata]|uniref:RNA-directed DNA polymerase protein n=1 Tax=Dioscorea alata TaxID=55571 RepID=A0ACB7VJR1_DIOAL|nr:RNA-directed DNA polymerase protein [Dioscorea alata]
MLANLGDFSLSVDFKSKKDNFCWRCTAVYGPIGRNLKSAFWGELRGSGGDLTTPWVLCGDFNAIFSEEDKASGPRNWDDIRQANVLLQDLGLLEPPSVGRMFTWTNGQENIAWVKLDRFLVNSAWAVRFPRMIQNSLPRVGSDHVPIRLEVGNHRSSPRPFRFELVWLTTEGFQDIVHRWWQEPDLSRCGAFIVSKKLAFLREKLRHWAKFSFGSIKLRKLALLHDLEELDIVKESRTLNQVERNRELLILESLGDIQGDENTKFFHAVANCRKNWNFIPRISHDEETFSEPRDIGNIFAEHFKQFFGRKRDFRCKINFRKLLEYKVPIDLTMLDRPFSLEEIRVLKKFWDIVKCDVEHMCEDFFNGRANLERINWASIALIPKVLSPETSGDYRPISLINSSLKIISKILATRLSKILSNLVDGTQSAFLRGRCILDNIATAEELIFSIHKRRAHGHILKVDFAKAFDTVDWDFLLELLKARGFSDRWGGVDKDHPDFVKGVNSC